MSQAGKVLHLYVEVRPVAEGDGKPPESRPCSQRSSNRSSSSYSPELSPTTHLQLGTDCVSPPRSSRQSVTFQLQKPDGAASPGQGQRHMCDSFGQLLQVLAPETLGHSRERGPAGPSWPPKQGGVLLSPSSTSSGRMSSPPTGLGRSGAVQGLEADGGHTSLVTYGYIEKSHVNKVAGQHPLFCPREPDRPFRRVDGPFMIPTQKRLSDPLWYTAQPVHGDHPSRDYPYSETPSLPQLCWSYAQRAPYQPVSRDARTVDDFPSPVLRRRYGGLNPASCSPTLPRNYQSPRCRSWAGSPVLPRGSFTLPSKPQPAELDRGGCHHPANGLPRSPASDRLCAHAQYPPCTLAPPRNVHCQAQRAPRPQVVEESPRLSTQFYPPLPAGRPTDIQHEVPVSWTGFHTSRRPHHSGHSSYTAHTASRSPWAADSLCYNASDPGSRRSVSPSANEDAAARRAGYACKLTAEFGDGRTPSPSSSPAESQRSESPNTEGTNLRPYASLVGQRSPEQTPPLTRPGRISPGPPKKDQSSQSQSPMLDLHRQRAPSPRRSRAIHHHHHPLQSTGTTVSVPAWDTWQRDSPGWSRRSQTKETPPSFASRNLEWRESTRSANGACEDERQRKVGGNLVSGEQTECLDPTGSGTSSQSSSGVTGSVGDSSHPSPETLSQSSQDTSSTGSALQVCWAGGCRGLVACWETEFSSPHSQ